VRSRPTHGCRGTGASANFTIGCTPMYHRTRFWGNKKTTLVCPKRKRQRERQQTLPMPSSALRSKRIVSLITQDLRHFTGSIAWCRRRRGPTSFNLAKARKVTACSTSTVMKRAERPQRPKFIVPVLRKINMRIAALIHPKPYILYGIQESRTTPVQPPV